MGKQTDARYEVSAEADAAEEAAIERSMRSAGVTDDEFGVGAKPKGAVSGEKTALQAAEEEERESARSKRPAVPVQQPGERFEPEDDDNSGDEEPDKGSTQEDELDLDLEFGIGDDDGYQTALSELERKGWKRKSLEKLPREDVLAMGGGDAAERGTADRGGADGAATGSGKKRTGDSPAVKALAERLGGDDEALVEAREFYRKAGVETGGERKAADGDPRLVAMEGQLARTRLEERFPQLKNSREYHDRCLEARDLLKSGRFRSFGGALQAACKISYADEQLAATDSRDAATNRRRAAGSPVSGGRKTVQKMTREKATDNWLARRIDGDRAGAKHYEKYLNSAD